MLHYVREGLVRSPNIIFDRIENSIGKEKYQFIHLNQKHLPNEIGAIKLIKELYTEIKQKNPDIIHISGIHEGFCCMIAAFLAGCKRRILITHGFASEVKSVTWLKSKCFELLTEPITLLLANEVQCNSWFSYNHKQVRRYARKRRMIYNIPLKEHILNDEAYFREKHGIQEEAMIFASVGNVELNKGFKQLTEVILQQESENIFVIIGDGSYLEKMKKRLERKVEQNKVIFTGRIPNEEVFQILKESNVFVLPTLHFETYGLVYVEAAFAKLPSIGTNIFAVPEVVQDGKTGILIEPENERQLKEAIQYFSEHPEEAKRMGKYAYEWATETFNRSKIAKQIDEMYEELLNGN